MTQTQTPEQIAFPHRRLTSDEAKSLGYIPMLVRKDDGTVESMAALPSGYIVTYGAPSYTSALAAILQAQEQTNGD